MSHSFPTPTWTCRSPPGKRSRRRSFPPQRASNPPRARWVPATCGLAALFLGGLYPLVDQLLGSSPVVPREWSTVMRCLIFFAGIAYASVVRACVRDAARGVTRPAVGHTAPRGGRNSPLRTTPRCPCRWPSWPYAATCLLGSVRGNDGLLSDQAAGRGRCLSGGWATGRPMAYS